MAVGINVAMDTAHTGIIARNNFYVNFDDVLITKTLLICLFSLLNQLHETIIVLKGEFDITSGKEIYIIMIRIHLFFLIKSCQILFSRVERRTTPSYDLLFTSPEGVWRNRERPSK